jgi:TonB-dependent receptor
MLESKVMKMESFTVAESARGQALAINQQKTASGIVNIVSEETFGQMISGNIGYTLQRLPGLSVNEDEDGTPNGVNIRGMESKYNSFQTDGFRTPTSGNSRGFATSQLLADGVSNIEVVKAPTADRDGDAIGGIINTISRSAFERDGREIKVTTAGVYYEMNNQWSYDAGLLYSDILSVGGGTKNLGVSFTVSAYETSRAYDNVDLDYFYVRPTDRPQPCMPPQPYKRPPVFLLAALQGDSMQLRCPLRACVTGSRLRQESAGPVRRGRTLR